MVDTIENTAPTAENFTSPLDSLNLASGQFGIEVGQVGGVELSMGLDGAQASWESDRSNLSVHGGIDYSGSPYLGISTEFEHGESQRGKIGLECHDYGCDLSGHYEWSINKGALGSAFVNASAGASGNGIAAGIVTDFEKAPAQLVAGVEAGNPSSNPSVDLGNSGVFVGIRLQR